jgi:hypothetical protein
LIALLPTRPAVRLLWLLAAVQALSAAEAVSRAMCPRVALVLLLTAQTYSRTGRVTLAEGLYREAAKMLQLKPGSEGVCTWRHGKKAKADEISLQSA